MPQQNLRLNIVFGIGMVTLSRILRKRRYPAASEQCFHRDILKHALPGQIFSIALCSFASNEWNYHDLNGLCKLLQSGPEYLDQVHRCES